jgi:hypothetical protein
MPNFLNAAYLTKKPLNLSIYLLKIIEQTPDITIIHPRIINLKLNLKLATHPPATHSLAIHSLETCNSATSN